MVGHAGRRDHRGHRGHPGHRGRRRGCLDKTQRRSIDRLRARQFFLRRVRGQLHLREGLLWSDHYIMFTSSCKIMMAGIWWIPYQVPNDHVALEEEKEN